MLNKERLTNLPHLSPRALKRLLAESDFDYIPKHLPNTPYKYELRMDDLNEPLAEPAPVSDTIAFG